MNRKVPARIRKLLKELKEGLVRIYGDRLRGVYLYGSYARGNYQQGSDLDILVVLKEYQRYGDEINRTSELVGNLSLEYGISISRVFMTETQWKQSDAPLLRNIRTEGLPA
jgi:predicted nucleotidyltransferase